jgi:hypothetical protein
MYPFYIVFTKYEAYVLLFEDVTGRLNYIFEKNIKIFIHV